MKYFSGDLKIKLGKVKDSDIARTSLNHLLKNGFFRSEDQLAEALEKPFFSKTILDPELYLQKWPDVQTAKVNMI